MFPRSPSCDPLPVERPHLLRAPSVRKSLIVLAIDEVSSLTIQSPLQKTRNPVKLTSMLRWHRLWWGDHQLPSDRHARLNEVIWFNSISEFSRNHSVLFLHILYFLILKFLYSFILCEYQIKLIGDHGFGLSFCSQPHRPNQSHECRRSTSSRQNYAVRLTPEKSARRQQSLLASMLKKSSVL